MEIRLWYVRTERGISLMQLEQITGISKSTLNNIENGKYSPKFEQLETIARALHIGIRDLVHSKYY